MKVICRRVTFFQVGRYALALLWLVGAASVPMGGIAKASPRAVDLQLVLTIDCSYSVDQEEFDLQVRGLAKALLDENVLSAIQSGTHGAIAIGIVQWSNAPSQILVLPWTVVSDRASAETVAAKLLSTPRLTQKGGTSISAVIDYAVSLLNGSPLRGARRIIDISSDGRNNTGRDARDARDEALLQGIVINGLAILNDVPTLHYYFEQFVIGGSGAFVLTADSYDDYALAIRQKLLREILGDKVSRRDQPGPALPQTAEAATMRR